jgi:hypothetical protein
MTTQTPIVLLAGPGAASIRNQLLVTRKFKVRLLDDLADCRAFREATHDCFGVFATPANVDQCRNVIKVVAGSEVEHLVIGAGDESDGLDAYARALGISPLFISPDAPHSAVWFFIKEFEEKRWQPFAAPYVY